MKSTFTWNHRSEMQSKFPNASKSNVQEGKFYSSGWAITASLNSWRNYGGSGNLMIWVEQNYPTQILLYFSNLKLYLKKESR